MLFPPFFLILTCSCQYSYNLMLTATYMFRFYILIITRQETPKLLHSYTCSLRLHLMHLISIISFKLGHVSITKRHCFSPRLFCAYDSSVLQNFKIFTHLLLHFSNSTLPLTEVEFESCVECNYFDDRARKVRKTFPDFILQSLGKVFRTFLALWLK